MLSGFNLGTNLTQNVTSLSRPRCHTSHKMAQRWKCLLCSFLCLFLGDLLSHLNSSHRNSVDFRQKCGLPRCKSNSEYTSTNSFVKHVRANHREIISSTYEAVFGVSQDLVADQENATGNTFWFLILIRLSHAIM